VPVGGVLVRNDTMRDVHLGGNRILEMFILFTTYSVANHPSNQVLISELATASSTKDIKTTTPFLNHYQPSTFSALADPSN
jgi:hypothetical protein